MPKTQLDAQDKQIISLLAEDGRLPVGEIANKVGASSPTIRSRIKRLIQSGILKVQGLVDPFRVPGVITAIVAINVEDDRELDRMLGALCRMEQVSWAVVLTGRYDILVEVILLEGMSGLYHFLTNELPQLGGIRSSESFVVMKAKHRWIKLPPEWSDG